MSQPMAKFWMVYGIGQRQPTKRHKSKESAQAEAQRLAREVPGTSFVVLAAVDAYAAAPPVPSRLKISAAIPFDPEDGFLSRGGR